MTSILGISAFYHDSAAALIVNGKILFLKISINLSNRILLIYLKYQIKTTFVSIIKLNYDLFNN